MTTDEEEVVRSLSESTKDFVWDGAPTENVPKDFWGESGDVQQRVLRTFEPDYGPPQFYNLPLQNTYRICLVGGSARLVGP
jgi:hypothetical protein